MHIHADFTQRVVIDTESAAWVASPMPGVERKMLDRVGDEVARATSIVRYAPHSRFSEHVHSGGEEFLVLQGQFNDATGSYPAGSYVRNPIGTAHAPWAGPEGTTIFVKLHQFHEQDTQQFAIDTRTAQWYPGLVPGLSVMPLHEHGSEHVALVKWAPNTRFSRHSHWGGEEILVLDGVFEDEHGRYPKGCWLRSPHLSQHMPFTGPAGALIYVKTGHLSETSLAQLA
jgi:anti-sigma factor ChrR (cupin superfamily)